MLAFAGLPGGTEWIIILIVALLIFGPRLPSVMRSLGKSLNEFKKGLRETEDDVRSAVSGDEESGEEPAGQKPAGDDEPPAPAE